MTLGLEVFVQEVIDAITTAPLDTEVAVPFTLTAIFSLLVFSPK